MTYGQGIFEQYYNQHASGIPLFGLIAYEPFDAQRDYTLVGNFPLRTSSAQTREYTSYKGVPCTKWDTGVYMGDYANGRDLTISQWICPHLRNNSFSGYFDSNANACYVSNQDNGNKLRITIGNSTYNEDIVQDKWMHICITHSSGTVSVYKDAVRKLSKAMTFFPDAAGLQMARRGSKDAGGYALGAAFRFYDRVLSQSEIARLSHEFEII